MDRMNLNMSQMETVTGGDIPSLSFDLSDEIRSFARLMKRRGDDKDEVIADLTHRYYTTPAAQIRKIVNEVFG